MKRLIAFCSTLCLGFLLVLTSCTEKNNLPNIEGSLDIKIFKTDISVTAQFIDSEEHDLYYDNVKSYVTVSSTGEDAKEISRKDVTITKPSTEEISLSGNKLDFSSLTSDTLYSVKLIISSKGQQKTLATKEVTTLSTGESEEDPILVDSLDMLLGMNKTKDAYYKLTTDIDCGGSISSIFNSSSTFAGTFDGDGHKIYNLKFDSNQYTGLFGYMIGATVKNLTIEAPEYSASRSNTYLGALAGYAKHCKISNITIIEPNFSHSGQTTTFAYIGGLVGQAENSTIENCTVKDIDLNVKDARLKMYVGGLVGENKNSKITDCYVTGNVVANISYTSNKDGCLYLGGFSGVNDSTLGISNCYSKVNVKVTEPENVTNEGRKTFKLCVGGFNGGNIHYASKFDNCASLGDLDITVMHAWFAYVGGFAGYTDNQNISLYDHCVYVPGENGLVAKFAKLAENAAEDAKIDQTAYISLTVGFVGAKNTNTIHTIAYSEKIEVINEHENLTHIPYVVSQDLTNFSSTIRDVVLEP
ncbi:MAG: hypothetical protein NC310_01240 [Roseburia sp.]|nr:hypothetical protein [Anaeroplasma bactoclasticum]MCM1195678.1 hypothetical protein [Roseburia sp.]MCM1556135.1 hypothetical protein [Anaeroplasma bactoclasticum]